MKLSKVGIVLLAIGLVIAILAPVWKWGIAPSFVKLPTDLDEVKTYEGVLTLYVDPTSMALLPPDIAIKLPLVISRTITSLGTEGNITNIEETVQGVGPGGKTYMEYERIYSMDRSSKESVEGYESDMDRTMYTIFLPFGVEKGTYEIFDSDTGELTDTEFVKEGTEKSTDGEEVGIYIFEGQAKEKLLVPPLGLPAEISGTEVKAIMGDGPEALAIPDDMMIPIDYLKGLDVTVAVEPKSGVIVNVLDYVIDYYVDASAAGMESLKLATIQYAQTPESAMESVDSVLDSLSKLSLVENTIPLILLLAGIAIMLLGLAVGLRSKS
ncbi:MAG: DUF3068 domain-containing protein [Actinobacteria bacterium]|nr:DUF3068 domain-containing protein [Actinomycetota bacterium]